MNHSIDRDEIAKRRLRNILSKHRVAHLRTLEQKIADAGPSPQRCDPHVITNALRNLEQAREILCLQDTFNDKWHRLAATHDALVTERLAVLSPLHHSVSSGSWTVRLGQALEIAVYKALLACPQIITLGGFRDLAEHDDSTLYKKIEPPSVLSGNFLPGNQNLDFIVSIGGQLGGIEVKNKRPWFYPANPEIKDLIRKCLALNIVPILIARRIHHTVWQDLIPLGLIVFQTYRQQYPAAEALLAAQARRKDLLGYHDIVVGNEPDSRMLKFAANSLPKALPEAFERFQKNRATLQAYVSS